MAVKILAMLAGILLFGGGGFLVFDRKGAQAYLGAAAQAVGLVVGLLGLILLVIPDFLNG